MLSMHCITGADGCRRLKGLANYALNMRGISLEVSHQRQTCEPLVSPPPCHREIPKAPPLCPALSFIVLFSRLRGREQPSLSQARRRRTKLSHVVPVNWLAESCWAGLGESRGLAASRFTAVSCYQKVRLDCALTRQLKMHAITWIIDLLAGSVASGQRCYSFFTTAAKKEEKKYPRIVL